VRREVVITARVIDSLTVALKLEFAAGLLKAGASGVEVSKRSLRITVPLGRIRAVRKWIKERGIFDRVERVG
jgi:hypothetical protein